MAWINPTSTTDSGGTWLNDDDAIDGNTGTYASSANNDNTNTLELNIAAISCDKIQIYASKYKNSDEDTGVVVDVYYSGDWHNVITATLTANTWTEGAIGSTQTVIAARVVGSGLSGGRHFRLKALQFNEIAAGPQEFYQVADGAVTFVGNVSKTSKKILFSTVNFTSILNTGGEASGQIITGVITFTGNLKRKIKKNLSGNLISLGTGLIIKRTVIKFFGLLNIGGELGKGRKYYITVGTGKTVRGRQG